MANTPEQLCIALKKLNVNHIQLAMNKSFDSFDYIDESVLNIAEVLKKEGIQVAVLGCYIDPRTIEGKTKFL